MMDMIFLHMGKKEGNSTWWSFDAQHLIISLCCFWLCAFITSVPKSIIAQSTNSMLQKKTCITQHFVCHGADASHSDQKQWAHTSHTVLPTARISLHSFTPDRRLMQSKYSGVTLTLLYDRDYSECLVFYLSHLPLHSKLDNEGWFFASASLCFSAKPLVLFFSVRSLKGHSKTILRIFWFWKFESRFLTHIS